MAVHRDRRSAGVGTAIIEALCEDLTNRGFKLALAMTSARPKDEQPDGKDPYEATRAFWFSRRFLPLTELDIWETDIALLMVRPLPARA
jgi:GNAT superfamily N-acetyltransferase